jgi:hypothetical protein
MRKIADGFLPRGPFFIVRVAAAAAPLMAASVLAPGLAPSVVMLAALLLYGLMQPVQSELYDYSQLELQFYLAYPVFFIFLAWGSGLAALKCPEQLGRSLGPFFLLTAISIWPAFQRTKRFKAKKNIPYEAVYLIVGALVFIQQSLIWGRG